MPEFAQTFLWKNRGRVLWLVATQAYVVWAASHDDGVIAVMFSLFVFAHSWELIRRAAGIPDSQVRAKTPEEMTPREAFWLDPAHVFRRGGQQSGATSRSQQ